jgi:N-acetylmuramoyl-L-alanine amidase
MTTLRGKCSWFGGPNDTEVSPSEGLAFIYEVDDAPQLFLPEQPLGTTGLARRLNPEVPYIACRWDYTETPKAVLPDMKVMVKAPSTGHFHEAWCADWGPHSDTGRVADLSPGLMEMLGITTDDEVIVEFPWDGDTAMPTAPYGTVCISSGHGKHVGGASGILDEVTEARRIVDRVANELAARGVTVYVFHDDVSTSQNENLNRIVSFHNSKTRDIDISTHLNASQETTKPMGTEVLYITQAELAGQMSRAIADAGGFIDRGAKKRKDLYFLNKTKMPAILLEICFVDSSADAELYEENFDEICDNIATVLGGPEQTTETPPPEVDHRPATVRMEIEVSGNVQVIINGVPVS